MTDLVTITMRGPGVVKAGGHRLIPRGVYAVPPRFAALAVAMGWADQTDAVAQDSLPELAVPHGILDGATGKPVPLPDGAPSDRAQPMRRRKAKNGA